MIKNRLIKSSNIIGWLLVFLIFLVFVFNINKGLSNLDEPFYLLWSLYPHEAKGGNSLFGFILNTFFSIFNYEIIYLRIFGVFALLSSTFLLIKECFHLFNNFSTNKINLTFYDRILLSVVILLIYRNWLLVPSYNLLVIISINFVIFFYFKILNKKNNFINFFLLSLSLIIIFFSKPSSLILIFFLLPFLFFCLDKKNILVFFGKIIPWIFLSLSCLILFYFNSFQEFFIFLKNGYRFGVLLGGGHELLSVFKNFYNNIIEAIIIYKLLFVILLLFFFFVCMNKKIIDLHFFIFLILIKIFLLIFYHDSIVLILPLFIFLFLMKEKNFILGIKGFFQLYFLFFFLILVPISFSIGSSNNFLKLFLFVSFYQILILYIFDFFKINQFFKKLYKLFITISVLIVLINASHHTYDEKKYYLKNNKITFLNNKHGIYIDEKKYLYLSKIKNIFLQNGWIYNSYLVDLSSSNALVSILINAKFVGIPIMSNEFGNADIVINAVIDKTDINKIKNAWLITSDDLLKNKDLLLKIVKLDSNYHIPIAQIEHFSTSKKIVIWSPINR